MKTTQVLVTGGSGFIGSWCVLALLQGGYEVRATVRDLARESALRAQLHAAAEFDDARLKVVRADLRSDDGWADAVATATTCCTWPRRRCGMVRRLKTRWSVPRGTVFCGCYEQPATPVSVGSY